MAYLLIITLITSTVTACAIPISVLTKCKCKIVDRKPILIAHTTKLAKGGDMITNLMMHLIIAHGGGKFDSARGT